MDSVASRVKARHEQERASSFYWQKVKEDYAAGKVITDNWGTLTARVKIRHARPGALRFVERWLMTFQNAK